MSGAGTRRPAPVAPPGCRPQPGQDPGRGPRRLRRVRGSTSAWRRSPSGPGSGWARSTGGSRPRSCSSRRWSTRCSRACSPPAEAALANESPADGFAEFIRAVGRLQFEHAGCLTRLWNSSTGDAARRDRGGQPGPAVAGPVRGRGAAGSGLRGRHRPVLVAARRHRGHGDGVTRRLAAPPRSAAHLAGSRATAASSIRRSPRSRSSGPGPRWPCTDEPGRRTRAESARARPRPGGAAAARARSPARRR